MLFYKIRLCGFESRCCHLNFRFWPVSRKEFIDIHATKECRFTLKTGMWHNSIQSIITIFMKQNYNSCNRTLQLNSTYFGNQCSVLTFQAKCRGLYSEPYQTFQMEQFAKIVNIMLQAANCFLKSYILDV